MKDLYHNLLAALSMYPQALTSATNGDATVDLAGFEGALIVIAAGTITDGTLYTWELKESDDNSTFTAVAAADLVGTESTFTAASEDNVVKSFSYIGSKRYVRVDLKTISGSPVTGGVFSAVVVKGAARHNAVQ
jgi:hypothetical protein